jgi:predicted nucleic acid-binding protein
MKPMRCKRWTCFFDYGRRKSHCCSRRTGKPKWQACRRAECRLLPPLIYRRAVELAIGLSHHLFDTLYHATALENEAVMITADRRYHDKAAHLGRIMLLEQLAA